jgi:hypothetical protein
MIQIFDRKPHMVDHDSIPSRRWAAHFPVSHRVGHSVLAVDNEATDDVADIYNQAGDDYVCYADGDPSQPFAFDGMHAYADRCVWAAIETKLADLRASGASSVRLLDAGCGPGTWLRRLIIRAHALGFSCITARGPSSFVDVIASPSFVAAITSEGAAVSGSLFAAIASDGADVSALVASVDDSASSSR